MKEFSETQISQLGSHWFRDNPSPVLFVEKDGRIICANEAFRNVFSGQFRDGHFPPEWLNQNDDIGYAGKWYRVSVSTLHLDSKEFLAVFFSDISSIKNSEVESKQKEKEFRLISEASSDLIAVLDVTGKRIYNNPRYQSIGFESDKMTGTDSFASVHPEDLDLIKNLFTSAVQTKKGARARYRMITPKGSIRYMDSQSDVVLDKSNMVSRVVCISRDITDLVEKEIELEEHLRFEKFSTQLSKEFASTSPIGITKSINSAIKKFGEFYNSGSVVVYRKEMIDDKLIPVYKWKSEKPGVEFTEWLSFRSMKDWEKQFWSDELIVVQDVIQESQKHKSPVKPFATTGYKSVLIHPFKVKSYLAGIVAIGLHDVARPFSERERSGLKILSDLIAGALQLEELEKERQSSDAKFKRIFKNAPEGMFILDNSGTIVMANDSVAKLVGVESSIELIGKKFSKFGKKEANSMDVKEQYLVANLSETLRKGQHSFEWEIVNSNGDKIPTELSMTTTAIDNETVFLCSWKDMSIARQAEEHRVARLVAEDSNMQKSEFLANISHEIRTPLHGILSFARFGVQKSEAATREKLKDYFSEILASGDVLLKLLNNLLDLAKLEANQMKFAVEFFDLNLVATETAKSFEAFAAEKKLAVQIEGDKSREFNVKGDRAKIAQVIRNLISNAIKFSSPDTVVTIGFDESDTKNGKRFLLSVKNSGVGIPKDELESIFNKFTQSSLTKTGAGGTGLGLAISREIVEKHGGRIWAESDQGITVFKIELPPDVSDSESKSEAA